MNKLKAKIDSLLGMTSETETPREGAAKLTYRSPTGIGLVTISLAKERGKWGVIWCGEALTWKHWDQFMELQEED